jgi:hypothetical protein
VYGLKAVTFNTIFTTLCNGRVSCLNNTFCRAFDEFSSSLICLQSLTSYVPEFLSKVAKATLQETASSYFSTQIGDPARVDCVL